jgi:hypothetical protein
MKTGDGLIVHLPAPVNKNKALKLTGYSLGPFCLEMDISANIRAD